MPPRWDEVTPQLSQLRARFFRPSVLGAVLVAFGYAPLLVIQLRRLWYTEHYSFFPMLLAAVAALTWMRLRPGATRYRRSAIALCGLAWLLLAGSVLSWSPWVTTVSAVLMAGAMLLNSPRADRSMFPVWLLLWFLVPLPFQLDENLIFSLQRISSKAGSYLLEFLGFDHLLTSHVIEIPGQRFLVEEACSGIRSLFALVAFAAVFVVWIGHPVVHSLLLLVAAGFWATAANALRVASIVMIQIKTNINAATGWVHELLGLSIFMFAIAMLICTDRLLLFCFEPIREPHDSDQRARDQAAHGSSEPMIPVVRANSSWLPLLPGVLFGLLGVVQFGLLSFGDHLPREPSAYAESLTIALGESTLLAERGGWRMVKYEQINRDRDSIFGNYSHIWNYERPTLLAAVATDFPFVGWHELLNCYESQGWETISWKVIRDSSDSSEQSIPYVQAMLRDRSGDTAMLLFSEVDVQGVALTPPPKSKWSLESLKGLIRRRIDKALMELGIERTTCQFQVLANGRGEFTDENRKQVTELFIESRRELVDRFLKAVRSK